MRPLLVLIVTVILGWFGGHAWMQMSKNARNRGPAALSAPNARQSATVETATRIRPGDATATDGVGALTSSLASIGNDPLTAESELYAALQGFSAEDFQRLTSDSETFEKLTEPLEKSWEVKCAFVAGFIERWIEVDERAAFEWFESRPKLIKSGSDLDYYAISTLARLRPERTMEAVLRMPEGDGRKGAASFLIMAIGETDLEKAKQWTGRFEDKATRDAAEMGCRIAWARIDPFGAVAAAASLPEGESEEVWRAAVNEAARRGAGAVTVMAEKATTPSQLSYATESLVRLEPAAAAKLIAANFEKFPNASDQSLASGIAREFAAVDLEGARDWADALPEKQRLAALSAVVRVWAATDPRAAMEWLADHPAREAANASKPLEQRRDASTEVFSAWLGRDEAGARAYAAALPSGEALDAMDAALIVYLTENGRAAEAAAKLVQSENLSGGTLAARVAQGMAGDDPMAAASWAASLPPGRNQMLAVQTVAGSWARRDPVSVANWIEQFPAGEVRDRAVFAYTESIAAMDPPASAEWVLQIADPWYRGAAASVVFSRMRKRDPRGAEQWLTNLPGIDEAIRRITLQDAR